MLCICDDCSQVWTIKREGELNGLPIRFCPCCGSPTLRMVKTVLSATFGGTCLKGVAPQLVLLLFSVWAQERNGEMHTIYPRFVDYVNAQLEG